MPPNNVYARELANSAIFEIGCPVKSSKSVTNLANRVMDWRWAESFRNEAN